jgi:hypothetical protein
MSGTQNRTDFAHWHIRRSVLSVLSRPRSPIGQCGCSLSSSPLKISEQHSREENELYLFVGSVFVYWVGLATVRCATSALSKLGGFLTCPRISPPAAGAQG